MRYLVTLKTVLLGLAILGGCFALSRTCNGQPNHRLRPTFFDPVSSPPLSMMDDFFFRNPTDMIEEFYNDIWFRNNIRLIPGSNLKCHHNFDINEKALDMNESIQKWEQDKRNEWEKRHQDRKLAWEENEGKARQRYFTSIERQKEFRLITEKLKKETSAEKSENLDIDVIGSTLTEHPNELLAIKISGYKVDDISVKVEGRKIFVHGIHKTGNCHQGNCVTSEFKKTFVLPAQVDKNSVRAIFDKYGVLRIQGHGTSEMKSKEKDNIGDSLRDNVKYSSTVQANKERYEQDSQTDVPCTLSNKVKDSDVNSIGDKYEDDDVTIEVIE